MADSRSQSLLKQLRDRYWLTVIVLLVVLAYWRLPFTFWQQDEWHHFGQEFIWHEKGLVKYLVEDAISPFGIRFLPLASLAQFVQFSAFGLNPVGYAFVSLGLHLANTFLVYRVAEKFSKDKLLAFLAASIFGVSLTSSQAVTWLLQHTTTLPALTFSLLSIYYFERAIISIIFLLLAVGFKETAFAIFPFLTFLPFLFHGWRTGLRKALPVAVVGVMYFLMLIGFMINQPRSSSEVFIPRAGLMQTLSRRVVSIPLRVVTQSIVPQAAIDKMSRMVVDSSTLSGLVPEKGTPAYDIFVEKNVAKKVIYLIGGGIILGALISRSRLVYIVLLLLACSAFPLLFVATLAGNFTYLDSRYLYLPSVGGSLLLSSLLRVLIKKGRYLGVGLSLLVLTVNVLLMNVALAEQVKTGKLRLAILGHIKSSYPHLPEKVVFYTPSDTAYYGLPPAENILPFQSGLGETLLVWYQGSESFPVDFFADDFLWPIESQGYKEISGRGFGYYRELDMLREAIGKYKLRPEAVIAFSWRGREEFLKDITSEVRRQLEER